MNKDKKILQLKNNFLIEKVEKPKIESENFVVAGYFKKWANQNLNLERYESTAYDEFIEEYFVKNKLNVVVNLMHGQDFEDLAGKIVLMEKNTVGIWVEVEISKHAINYANILGMIEEGILQGFSDEGYSTDYDVKFDSDGNFSHYVIKKANLLRVSLVDTPAEATAKFSIQNATNFEGFNNPKHEQKNKALPFLK